MQILPDHLVERIGVPRRIEQIGGKLQVLRRINRQVFDRRQRRFEIVKIFFDPDVGENRRQRREDFPRRKLRPGLRLTQRQVKRFVFHREAKSDELLGIAFFPDHFAGQFS